MVDSSFKALAKRKIEDNENDERYSELLSSSSDSSVSGDSESEASGDESTQKDKKFNLFGGSAPNYDDDNVSVATASSASKSIVSSRSARSEGSAGSAGSADSAMSSMTSSSNSSKRRRTTSDFMRNVDPNRSTQHVKIGGKYEELTNEEINTMKLDVLYRIGVLNQAGYTSPKEYSLEDSYTALEMEVNRLQTLETMSYGLQIMRWGLVNGVSLIEACNENFRLTPLKLKGWSTSIHRKSQTLDPILMELYQQWAYRFNVGPMTKLTCALLFSAVNVHMSNVIRDGAEGKETGSNGNDVFSNLMGAFGSMMGGGRKSNDSSTPTTEFRATPAPGSEQNDQKQQPQPTMRGPSNQFT